MVVSFPDTPTTSCARNGSFKSTGLMMQAITSNTDPDKHEVWIEALTSKGTTASGFFAVPVARMPEVIAAMQQLLHEYHSKQGSAYGYEPVVELPNQSNGRLIAVLPCGREVHIRREDDNAGTQIMVLAGPNAEQQDQSITYRDADNATPDEG